MNPEKLIEDYNFNSIKVRLEPDGNLATAEYVAFQFHKGTIRTYSVDRPSPRSRRFQFHKGTIRTSTQTTWVSCSLKFQFHKGTIRTTRQRYQASHHDEFQFHKGTIRTLMFAATLPSSTNFNSIKVRLEPFISFMIAFHM